jgi:hypothetical protein
MMSISGGDEQYQAYNEKLAGKTLDVQERKPAATPMATA